MNNNATREYLIFVQNYYRIKQYNNKPLDNALIKNLINLINYKFIFPKSEYLNKVINYIYHPQILICSELPRDDILTIAKYLLDTHIDILTINSIGQIICTDSIYGIIIQYLKTKSNLKFKIIHGISTYDNNNSIRDIVLNSLKYMNILYENEDINILIKNIETIGDYITSFYSNTKLIPPNNILDLAISKSKLQIVKDLLSLGCELNNSHLKIACINGSNDLINFILDSKIIPNNIDVDNYILYVINNKYSINNQIIENILNKFFDCGAIIKNDHIIQLLRSAKFLRNINKYNILINKEELQNLCDELCYYPYPQYAKPNQKILEKECGISNNLTNIKKISKLNNLSPNINCLENACKFKKNLQTINYLMDKPYNIPPNRKCVNNILEVINNTSSSKIINSFINEYDKKLELINTILYECDESKNYESAINKIKKILNPEIK